MHIKFVMRITMVLTFISYINLIQSYILYNIISIGHKTNHGKFRKLKATMNKLNNFHILSLKSLNDSRTYEIKHAKGRPSQLVQGLLSYYQAYNKASIPIDYQFNITNEDSTLWDPKLSGYLLGKSLKTYITKYNTTFSVINHNNLTLEFTVEYTNNFHHFDSLCTALSMYRILNNGSLVIPKSWMVPPEYPWPKECWYMKLGSKVVATRAGRIHTHKEHIDKLNQLGFIWSPSYDKFQLIYKSIQSYKSLYGHVNIPKHFIVPISDYYPEETWGLKLGLKLNNYRYRGDYNEYTQELEDIGIDDRHWDYIYEAILLYKQRYNHIKVPYNWIVPNTTLWPEKLWGLKLGYRMNNIKYRGDFILENENCRLLLLDLGINCKI